MNKNIHKFDRFKYYREQAANSAWEKAATVARRRENQEWAENRRLFCAHYVRYPARRPEVNHG